MAKQSAFPTKQSDEFFTITGNMFHLIKRSWEAVRLNLVTFLLIYLLPTLLWFLLILAVLPLLGIGLYLQTTGGDAATLQLGGAGAVLAALVLAGFAVLIIFLAIATVITQLESVRGNTISFPEAINRSVPYFWKMLGLALAIMGLVILGLILFILPGLLIAFFLLLSSYVLIDRDTSISDALRTSYEVVKTNWKVVLALVVVQVAITLPSTIPFLGTIVTAVLTIAYFCLPAIVYLRLTGQEPGKS